MLVLKEKLAQAICSGLKTAFPAAELTPEDVLGMLEYPPDPALGDFALPCFKLSKTLRSSPIQIAEKLAAEFGCRMVNRPNDNFCFVAHPDGLVFEVMRAGAEI